MATMSHELRTSLNGLLGMTEDMGPGDLSARQRGRLEVIMSSGAVLVALLDDLLDLSKVEAGKVSLETGVLDIQELADGAQATFEALINDKDVSFHLTLAPSARGHWIGDPKRIRQVLHNLISSAVEFTDRGWIEVEISDASDRLVLRVRVTGVGLASDRLAGVFDRPLQAEVSTTPRFGEAGFGLDICRDLVSLMGGDIQVESAPRAGTDFIVSLPLARTAPPRAAAAFVC